MMYSESRWPYGRLFLIAQVTVIMGMIGVVAAGGERRPIFGLGLVVAFTFAFWIAFWVMRAFSARWHEAGDGVLFSDRVLFPMVSLLSGLGLVLTYRLAPELSLRQLLWIVIGLGVMVSVMGLVRDYRSLGEYKYLAALAGIVLLTLTILFGQEIGGAKSWLGIGQVRFEPSEAVKILAVIFLAGYLHDVKEALTVPARRIFGLQVPGLVYVGPLLIMWGLSLVLLVYQRDLGAAFLLFAVFLVMVYVASGRLSYVVLGLLLLGLGGLASYQFFDHVKARVDMWINPWVEPDARGYQILQSLFAIGSGGLFGRGLGLGKPTVIPAVETDFVFASVVEELGLFGGVGLIVAFFFLAYRGLRIALLARSEFGMLLATGLTSLMVIQALTIMGGTVKLVPLTGVTLPFVSYGGSSTISSFAIAGLLMKVAGRDGYAGGRLVGGRLVRGDPA